MSAARHLPSPRPRGGSLERPLKRERWDSAAAAPSQHASIGVSGAGYASHGSLPGSLPGLGPASVGRGAGSAPVSGQGLGSHGADAHSGAGLASAGAPGLGTGGVGSLSHGVSTLTQGIPSLSQGVGTLTQGAMLPTGSQPAPGPLPAQAPAAALAAPPAPPAPPVFVIPSSVFERYRLGEVIGEGAFGRVYAAWERSPRELAAARRVLEARDAPGRAGAAGAGPGAAAGPGPGACGKAGGASANGAAAADGAANARGGSEAGARGGRAPSRASSAAPAHAHADGGASRGAGDAPRPPSSFRNGAKAFDAAGDGGRSRQSSAELAAGGHPPPSHHPHRRAASVDADRLGLSASDRAQAGSRCAIGPANGAADGDGSRARGAAPAPAAGASSAGPGAPGAAPDLSSPSCASPAASLGRSPLAIKVVSPSRPGEGACPTALREASLLSRLRHPNLASLKGVHADPAAGSLALVFGRLDDDLAGHLSSLRRRRAWLPRHSFVALSYQLLCALDFLHANWIVHRDLKPSNVLLSTLPGPEQGRLRLADLGLARPALEPLLPLGANGAVVTVWYRAPELLLGARHYTPAIDLWAAGCVLCEMLMLRVLFHGPEPRALDQAAFQAPQLSRIFDALGHPTDVGWEGVEALPRWRDNTEGVRARRPEHGALPLRRILWDRSPLLRAEPNPEPLFNLIESLLALDPSVRITAKDALKHPFFADDMVTARCNAFAAPPGGGPGGSGDKGDRRGGR